MQARHQMPRGRGAGSAKGTACNTNSTHVPKAGFSTSNSTCVSLKKHQGSPHKGTWPLYHDEVFHTNYLHTSEHTTNLSTLSTFLVLCPHHRFITVHSWMTSFTATLLIYGPPSELNNKASDQLLQARARTPTNLSTQIHN